MAHALRSYFLAFYGIGLLVFVVKVIPASLRVSGVERRTHGMARLLPPVLVLWNFALPPFVVFSRVGELDVGWTSFRMLGFGLSLYAATMLLWTAATLGRFLVPQTVVLADHQLITHGPYRFVRHPAYSADLALWLGAALGTANVLLLGLWPIAALGTSVLARQEDVLLTSRFGAEYECYARTTRAFV